MTSTAGPSRVPSMESRAGPSARPASRSSSAKSKTPKRAQQEKILNQLIEVTVPFETSTLAAQRNKALQVIAKDTWSPSDLNEITGTIEGLCRRHVINLSSELAQALHRCYSELQHSAKQAVELTHSLRETYNRKGKDSSFVKDPLVRPDNLADMVKLLLTLSKPADVTARTAASLLLNATEPRRTIYLSEEQRRAAEKTEWLKILAEDPLQGEIWAEEDEKDTKSDLSEWSADSDEELSDEREDRWSERRKAEGIARATDARDHASTGGRSARHQQQVEWTRLSMGRRDALRNIRQGFRINDQDELEGELTELDAVRESLSGLLGQEGLIFRRDSQQQFSVRDRAVYSPSSSKESSIIAQLRIVAEMANSLQFVRTFAHSSITQGILTVDAQTRSSAVEAFAEQVQILLERFDLKLSEYDADLAAHLTGSRPCFHRDARNATMPQLISEVEREVGSVLLISRMLQDLGLSAPASFADHVVVDLNDKDLIDSLQTLLSFVQDQNTPSQCNQILEDLSNCLLAASAPAWRSTCHLIQRGLSFASNRQHDPLFDDRLINEMIRQDKDIATADREFWLRGYNVNVDEDGEGAKAPAFLVSIIGDVLVTAKSVGLLRSLGIDALGELKPCTDLAEVLGYGQTTEEFGDAIDDTDVSSVSASHEDDFAEGDPTRRMQVFEPKEAREHVRSLLFRTFEPSVGSTALVREESGLLTPPSEVDLDTFGSQRGMARDARFSRLLEPALSRCLRDHLAPIMNIVRKRLLEAITSPVAEGGWDLPSHLSAAHGLFLMERGTDMSDWCDALFADLKKPNGLTKALEFHRLNSGLRDVIESNFEKGTDTAFWIDTNLIRMIVDDGEASTAATIRSRTRLRRLADVEVEYQMPWPINFCYPLECMTTYQAIFSMLLQTKYAFWKVSSTLKTAKPETVHMRKFWSLRQHVQWLVRMVMEYLQRDVIETSLDDFRSELESSNTLDSIVETHVSAMARMRKLCFMEEGQKKVKDLLDAGLVLSTEVVHNYEEYIGESSQDEDRRARHKRKERRKRRKAKVKEKQVPLGAIVEEDEDEDEDDKEDEDEDGADKDEGAFGAQGQIAMLDPDRSQFALTQDLQGDVSASFISGSSFDVSMSNASWSESMTERRERFRTTCERQRKALARITEELKTRIDEQIGKLAAEAATQVRDPTGADQALKEHHYIRQRWQNLLYVLEESP